MDSGPSRTLREITSQPAVRGEAVSSVAAFVLENADAR